MQRALADDPIDHVHHPGPNPARPAGRGGLATSERRNASALHPRVHGRKIQTVLGGDDAGHRPVRGAAAALSQATMASTNKLATMPASIGKDSRSLEDFQHPAHAFRQLPTRRTIGHDPPDVLHGLTMRMIMSYTLRQRYFAQEIALIWEYSRVMYLTRIRRPGPHEADFDLFEQQLLIDTQPRIGWTVLDAAMRRVGPNCLYRCRRSSPAR